LTLKNGFLERVIFVPDFRLACPGVIMKSKIPSPGFRMGENIKIVPTLKCN